MQCLRRSREEILIGILKACSSEKVAITQLVFGLNLSHRLLQSCLTHLGSWDLIRLEVRGRKRLVATTDRGSAALKCYRNAIALLNGQPSNCPLIQDHVIEQKTGTVF